MISYASYVALLSDLPEWKKAEYGIVSPTATCTEVYDGYHNGNRMNFISGESGKNYVHPNILK